MKGSSRQDKSRAARIQLIAGLLLAAFLVGIFWGWLQQPGFLLEIDPSRLPKVVQKETIKEQFWFASMMSNQEPVKEEALLSVRKYFPPEESKTNERYARLSDQKLADLYLEQGRLTAAADLYRSLADLPAAEQELRVFGLVGQANVHQRRKEGPQKADKLAQVRVIYETLRPSLQREVQQRMNPDLREEFVRGLRTERGNTSRDFPRGPSSPRPRTGQDNSQ